MHFLAIGAGLFALFRFTSGGAASPSSRIVVPAAQIEQLSAAFSNTWQRPPSEEELKGLLDNVVREEIAYREAMAMGLDRGDTIVRRRLRQKVEFLWEEGAGTGAPSEAQLQAWLQSHAASYRLEPQVAFRQVYLDSTRRGDHAQADAARLLAHVKAGGKPAGDSLMLPEVFGLVGRGEVERVFGDAFADRLLKVEPGQWEGPLESGYGLHLVFVTKRVEGRLPELSEVRPAVERDLTAAHRKEQLDATYRRLLEKYPVVLEKRTAPAKGTTPSSGR